MSAPADRRDVARYLRRCAAEGRPGVHQLPALLEQITTQIGLFSIVADAVCERHLNYFAGKGGLLACPILERATKPVRGRRAARQLLRQPPQRYDRDRLSAAGRVGEEDVAVTLLGWCLFQDDPRRGRQRDAVRSSSFHAFAWHGPGLGDVIDLVP